MITDNTIMLSMVHNLQLSNRHEVMDNNNNNLFYSLLYSLYTEDGAPQTSTKTKLIGHASSGYLKVAEGPSGADCEY